MESHKNQKTNETIWWFWISYAPGHYGSAGVSRPPDVYQWKACMSNLIDTIDYFIREQEAELESISWEIREETNYEDNLVDRLSEDYDFHKEHLENLKTIRDLILEKTCDT